MVEEFGMRWFMSPVEERQYALKSMRDFLDDTGGDRDWDNFTTYSLKDKQIDAIRKEAFNIDLPLNNEGREKLGELLMRLQNLNID
jgi:hypothetical protein